MVVDTKPDTLALLAALDRADKAVDDLCSGKLRWEMRIPAEPDHDPDLIISHALHLARLSVTDGIGRDPREADPTDPETHEEHE